MTDSSRNENALTGTLESAQSAPHERPLMPDAIDRLQDAFPLNRILAMNPFDPYIRAPR